MPWLGLIFFPSQLLQLTILLYVLMNHSSQLWNSFSKDNETTPTYVKWEIIRDYVQNNPVYNYICFRAVWRRASFPFFFMRNDPSWLIPGCWSLVFFPELLCLWPEPRTHWSNTNLPAYWRGNKTKWCKNLKKGIMLISIGVTQWDQEHFNYLSYPVRDKPAYI